MKKLIIKSFVLAIAFVVVGCSDVMEDLCIIENETKSENLKHAESEEIALNLEDSFLSTILRSEGKIYPEYYGGSYIENGNFVVLVTEDTTECRGKLLTRTKSQDFLVKPCKFSYNELLDVHKIVLDFFMNEENNRLISEISINSLGISAKGNSIFISLNELTPEKIALFKSRVVDSPIITFEQAHGQIVAQAASIVPGGHVSLIPGGLGGSTGYRAKMGTTTGIVASGHVLSTLNAKVYRNTTLIGTVKKVQLSGSVDAAFVALDSGFEGTNSIGTTSVLTSIEVLGEGGKVSLRGYYNQSDGVIYNTGVACNVKIQSTGKIVRISNCTRCKYNSQNGDSGGLIYSTNRNNTVGIHEGADEDPNGYSYYVLAHSINDALGLSRY